MIQVVICFVFSVVFCIIIVMVGVTFKLSQASYRAIEGPNTMLTVAVSKAPEVFIANNATLMVIPLTVDQALQQGVIDEFEPLNLFSPNRAGYKLSFFL